MSHDLILGTAGHIDHGKTSLIRALTGTDTDRLPEEKQRGITIELGFAQLDLGEFRLGIVDVPGHERFVRNMLAGATGMDLAMLVIAADDSIKQQTREHHDILQMLQLNSGVIALSKIDLVEEDWLDLVEEEIRELVKGTFLENAKIVRVSSKTGQGVEELKQALSEAAQQAIDSGIALTANAPFRMAIDRTFTIAGHGTVVTGSVSSGQVNVGDTLMVEPGETPVRVRSLQNHDQKVERIARGQRAAINLTGIHHDQTERGHELAAEGYLVPSRILNVEMSLLPNQNRPLKDRKRVRLHVGTAEILSTVRILGGERLEPGQTCLAQLFLQQPAVSAWSQPIVIRSESPVMTIGGGRVTHPCPDRIRSLDETTERMLKQLSSQDQIERASASLYFAGLEGWQPSQLSLTAGIEDVDQIYSRLVESDLVTEIAISASRTIRVHRDRIGQLADQVRQILDVLHDRHPLRSQHPLDDVRNAFNWIPFPQLLNKAFQSLSGQKLIRLTDRGIALNGRGPKLSQNEQKLLTQIVEWFRDAELDPPTVELCQKRATKNKDAVPQLIQLAVANGDLAEIGQGIYVHDQTEQAIRDKVSNHLKEHGQATVAEIRDALNTTRKFAVPICEYLDRIRFTVRDGDTRRLAESSNPIDPIESLET